MYFATEWSAIYSRILSKWIWIHSWIIFIVDTNMLSHTQTLVRMCSVRRFRSSQLPPFLQPLSCPLLPASLLGHPLVDRPTQLFYIRKFICCGNIHMTIRTPAVLKGEVASKQKVKSVTNSLIDLAALLLFFKMSYYIFLKGYWKKDHTKIFP